ncbi:AfsR/SARP family transcriptional regulator [Plantactinospora veratri]
MRLTVRVLGPIEVHLPSGIRPVRGCKPVSLLTILLSQANRSVSLDRLVAALWDAEPPRSAVANIRTYVQILRDLLHGSSVRLERESGGYLLRVTEADCDHLSFARLVTEAYAETAGPRRTIERLERALQLWRGAEAAAGVPRHGAVGTWLNALDEQRLRAVERIAEARVAVGEPDRAVRDLDDLLAVAPLRSRAWWLKILAHHRLGEHDLALAGYRSAASVFRDELGIEPDPELTELYRSLLRWEPVAIGGGVTRPAEVTPIRPASGPAAGPPAGDAIPPDAAPAGDALPVGGAQPGRPGRQYRLVAATARPEWYPLVHRVPEPPPLIGRNEVLAELRAALLSPERGPGARVEVVHGPPGVGTSALAQRAAHDLADAYPDGQLYLDLRGWPSGGRAGNSPIQAVLRRLSVVPSPDDVVEAGDLLRTASTGRRLLLLADNVTTPAEVRPLLSLATGCCLLITCGYPLGVIPAAQRLALRPLGVADAAELLRGLLGRERGGEELDHLAVLCGGLPLALRIAAARLIDQPTLPAAALINRLRDDRRALAELEVDDLSLRSRLLGVLRTLGAEARQAFPGSRNAASSRWPTRPAGSALRRRPPKRCSTTWSVPT